MCVFIFIDSKNHSNSVLFGSSVLQMTALYLHKRFFVIVIIPFSIKIKQVIYLLNYYCINQLKGTLMLIASELYCITVINCYDKILKLKAWPYMYSLRSKTQSPPSFPYIIFIIYSFRSSLAITSCVCVCARGPLL